MNNRIWRGTAYWAFCFVVLMTIAVVGQEYGPLPHLSATLDEIIRMDPTADPASFASGAKDIVLTGWIAPERSWIAQFWPPGFILLEAGIVKSIGLHAPVVIILQVFACLAWATTMTLQRQLLKYFANPLVAAAIPFIPLFFQTPRAFLVERYGVVLGETFSVAFFISGGLLTLLAFQRKSVRYTVCSGACFALAAYFRSQYELILLAMTGVAIPFAALYWHRTRKNQESVTRVFILKSIIVSLFTAHLMMIPWRAYHFLEYRSPAWVFTSNIIVRNSLMPEDELKKGGGEFVVLGGGGLACKLEPEYCGETKSSYFYKAFLKHAPQWYSTKIGLLPTFWFQKTGPDGTLFSYLCLVSMLGLLPLLVACVRYAGWPLAMWATLSFFSAFFVIFTLVHFEFRYFYLVKIYSLITFLNLAAITWNLYRQRRSTGDLQQYSARPA
jgi:hypothetical protein